MKSRISSWYNHSMMNHLRHWNSPIIDRVAIENTRNTLTRKVSAIIPKKVKEKIRILNTRIILENLRESEVSAITDNILLILSHFIEKLYDVGPMEFSMIDFMKGDELDTLYRNIIIDIIGESEILGISITAEMVKIYGKRSKQLTWKSQKAVNNLLLSWNAE